MLPTSATASQSTRVPAPTSDLTDHGPDSEFDGGEGLPSQPPSRVITVSSPDLDLGQRVHLVPQIVALHPLDKEHWQGLNQVWRGRGGDD